MAQARAKFKVTSVQKHDTGLNLELNAVTEHDGDNEYFWKYTPAGSLTMYITNPALYDSFELGQIYYIDLTKVD